jgi:hypothetical protein
MIVKGALLRHLNWVIVASPMLAALTTWWALRGELLMVPVAAFVVVLACAPWGWKILRSGRVFFETCPAPTRSASGGPQEIVLVHSPLQQVSRLSNPMLRSQRYIGEVQKKLSCSRFQYRQTC